MDTIISEPSHLILLIILSLVLQVPVISRLSHSSKFIAEFNANQPYNVVHIEQYQICCRYQSVLKYNRYCNCKGLISLVPLEPYPKYI